MKPIVTILIPYPVKVKDLSYTIGDVFKIIAQANKQSKMIVACGFYSLN